MTLHLLRTAVGAQSVEQLQRFVRGRVIDWHGREASWISTRRYPTRADEILESGGSLYWIVQRQLCVRQKIVDIIKDSDDEGRSLCRIFLEADLIRTQPYERRHIQGWRYLQPKDAPPDLRGVGAETEAMPPHMVAELGRLGLL